MHRHGVLFATSRYCLIGQLLIFACIDAMQNWHIPNGI